MLTPGTQTINDRPSSLSTESLQPRPAGGTERGDRLPVLASALTPSGALDAMLAMAKRGELGGFERSPEGFVADVHSEPFDHRLVGRVREVGRGCEIECTIAMIKRGPLITLLILGLSLWPGMWLTETMLSTYFSGYTLTSGQTALWYVPLTLLPLPWMIRGFVRSRELARREARVLVDRVGKSLGATARP